MNHVGVNWISLSRLPGPVCLVGSWPLLHLESPWGQAEESAVPPSKGLAQGCSA